jgi:hypothetical protein
LTKFLLGELLAIQKQPSYPAPCLTPEERQHFVEFVETSIDKLSRDERREIGEALAAVSPSPECGEDGIDVARWKQLIEPLCARQNDGGDSRYARPRWATRRRDGRP